MLLDRTSDKKLSYFLGVGGTISVATRFWTANIIPAVQRN